MKSKTARANRPSLLSILLLFVLIMILPSAFADGGDYLHHLWALDAQSRQNQAFYNTMYNSNRNAICFCAIAYSVSTDKWGYSWGKPTEQEAEQESITNCGAKDAESLCWSKGSWYCALADGPDSYGAASGETPAIANAAALKLANSNGPGSRIVLLVGGNPPIVKTGDSAVQQGTVAPATGPNSGSFGLNLLNNGPSPRH